MNEIVDKATKDTGGETAGFPQSALQRSVSEQIGKLQAGYLADAPWAVAALAKLRNGIGREPGELIELAAWTSPGIYVEEFREDTVAPQERAAYIAITLYSLHQQGQKTSGMHRRGRSFAEAARALRIRLGEHGEAGILRRFNALGTAQAHEERVHHARGMIPQFRAEDISFDYGLFANDLMKLDDARSADGVRARWGRHFHRPGHPREDAASASETSNPG